MNRVLILFYVVLMFLYTTAFDADRYVMETAHLRLKNALNRGAHDASLQVDASYLAEGRVIFDQAAARNAFLAGLAANLQLGSNLEPLPSTLFKEAPVIVFEDYVDERASLLTFPHAYTQPEQGISQMLSGPAVVYRVRIKLPATNRYSYDGSIYKTVIFEYPN